MNTSTTSRSRTATAAIGFGALVLSALGGATAASAEASPSNIDPDERGSISLHKFETPEGGAAGENNSGEELDSATTDSWTPLEGVVFQIQKIDEHDGTALDLTTFEGWNALDGLTASDLDDTTVYGADASATTDAAGLALFNDLDLGVYLVTETEKPAHVSSTVAPFLLTIPTPNGNLWNYDVHSYPKNSTTSINKTVQDNDQKAIGDSIVWTIDVGVPALSGDEEHSKFEITDNLPEEVEYTSSVVEFDGVEVDASNYDIDVDSEGNPTLSLTAAGLAQLTADGVEDVTWEIDTLVTALAEDGILVNDASSVVNDSDPINDSAEQLWGGIALTKTAEDEPSNTLQGAEFQLFKTAEDAGDQTDPIEVDGVNTFVTDENGVVNIAGVQTGTYFLTETKAPAGYTLTTNVIEVEVTAGGPGDLVQVEVENKQKDPFELPPLGAAGMVGMIGAGAVLLAAGGALVLRNRRAGESV